MRTATKERPILFSGAMVRAILEGRKTQTRRIVEPQPVPADQLGDEEYEGPKQFFIEDGQLRTPARYGSHPVECPYGKPGDGLWVQEAFSTFYDGDPEEGGSGDVAIHKATYEDDWSEDPEEVPWMHGRRMPRWASRLALSIKSIRVERLWQITNTDAMAEGVSIAPHRHGSFGSPWEPDFDVLDPHPERHDTDIVDCFLCPFRDLWQSLHGADSWSTNPWVWVIEFRQQPPPATGEEG